MIRPLLLLLFTTISSPLAAADLWLLHANPTQVRAAAPAGHEGGGELQLQFAAGGRQHLLRVGPSHGLGVLQGRLQGRALAYQGKVPGYANSWAALTRIGTRWSGIWYDGGDYYGIDSAGSLAGLSDAAAAQPSSQLMVYRLRDMVWEDSLERDTKAVPQNAAQLAGSLLPGAVQLPPAGPTHRLQVALVADAMLAAQDGEAAEANLLARLNIIDGLFANQLGVQISASSVTVYGTHAEEPFSRTTDTDALLDEISAWRADNLVQRNTGLTHVFTGRNLDGRTVGMAFMDSLCTRRYSASLSQATSSVSFAALIGAHEIAHVFGAPHDGDAAGACAAVPTDFLMAPRIYGTQQFSDCSLQQMAARVAAASCLVPVHAGSWGEEVPLVPARGGGGALCAWHVAALGLLMAMRLRRRQILANHSAR